MRQYVHRVHYFTGSGSLCGTLVVIDWAVAREAVTCPQCRALLCVTSGVRPANRDHSRDEKKLR